MSLNNDFVIDLLNGECPAMVKGSSYGDSTKWNYACINLHCRFMHVVWTYTNSSGVPNIVRYEVATNDAMPGWAMNEVDWD